MSESKQLTPVQELQNNLVKRKDTWAEALPPQISKERFFRVTQTAILTNGDLVNAERNSLFLACQEAAAQGLLPDGKEAALLAFKSKGQLIAKFIPMVKGILKQARNSGELQSIGAHIVREGDEFEEWTDENGEHFKHVPNRDRPGEAKMAYAIAKTKSGGVYFEVMTKQEIEKAKASSRSKNSEYSPWNTWPQEMWKKTVIKRLSKRLPMSTDLEKMLHADDEDYAVDVTPEHEALPAKTTSTRLQEAIETSEEVI